MIQCCTEHCNIPQTCGAGRLVNGQPMSTTFGASALPCQLGVGLDPPASPVSQSCPKRLPAWWVAFRSRSLDIEMQCSILLSLKPCWTRTPRHWHRCTGCTITTRNKRCHLQSQPYTSPMEKQHPKTPGTFNVPMGCNDFKELDYLAMLGGDLNACNPNPTYFCSNN